MTTILDRIKQQNEDYIETVRPPFPKNMLLELNNTCNHKCIFCGSSKMTRKKGQMEKKFVLRVLAEAYKEGTREIGFYNTGEPFMAKNLSDYIHFAKKIGYEYIYISTNGALATPEKAKSVIDSGLDSIKFSINAFSKETYIKIHGSDDFDKVIENIKFFSDYRKQNNLNFKIYVTVVQTDLIKGEIEYGRNLLSPYVDDFYISIMGNQGGKNNYSNQPSRPKQIMKKCSMIYNTINISCEGYLTACCVD